MYVFVCVTKYTPTNTQLPRNVADTDTVTTTATDTDTDTY